MNGTTQTANQNTATGVVGTAVGAATGAAIGAATANVGTGAAIGGGAGLLGGTAMGSNAGAASEKQFQRQYDIAYQQCMYAKGTEIPGFAPARRTHTPPPQLNYQQGAPAPQPGPQTPQDPL